MNPEHRSCTGDAGRDAGYRDRFAQLRTRPFTTTSLRAEAGVPCATGTLDGLSSGSQVDGPAVWLISAKCAPAVDRVRRCR
ncbi:MAG: hypothetical protein WBF21_24275 [Steroidobacteraceae bacterium]